MKRLIVLLLILSISRATVTFGNPNTGLTIRDYFFGNSAVANSDVNQVLALLVGPQGPPGPAGVAGKDGFNGINGLNGRDGIPGAPGPVGPQGPQGERGDIGPQGLVGLTGATGAQGPAGAIGPQGLPGSDGASVLIQQIAVGDPAQCSGRGGTKFISGLTISFACNGATGPAGATGATGARGPAGGSSSSSASNSLGQGEIDIGSCDDQVTFKIGTYYRGDEFVLDGVRILDVHRDCLNSKLVLYFKIKSSPTLFLPSASYAAGDLATCDLDLAPSISKGSEDSHIFDVPSDTECDLETEAKVGKGKIFMYAIGTRDLSGLIGFEIVGQ